MKLVSIVGARPQFIKVAPIIWAIARHNKMVGQASRLSPRSPRIEHILIHTGQHYDYIMSKAFFEDFDLPAPDVDLEVGSGSHGKQTGEMLARIETALEKIRPDWVLVFGDTNTTIAGALAAAKLHIRVAHVESGIRSFNRAMPEEINRIATDHISDVLFAPSMSAVKLLAKEGIKSVGGASRSRENSDKSQAGRLRHQFPRVEFVGDVMHDVLLKYAPQAKLPRELVTKYNLAPRNYYLATVHRAENTDNPQNLRNIITAFGLLKQPVIFPAHPRTVKRITELGIALPANVHLIEPLRFLPMLAAEKDALRILTDSGGVQKEAYTLGVPCITMRTETEWPETAKSGMNTVSGTDPKRIVACALAKPRGNNRAAFYGKGDAAEKIVRVLAGRR
jgi:UDP-N-acetylglucosamine 2-epimerase